MEPPFSHVKASKCFCGKPTSSKHDFFCSRACAREDSMRSLFTPNSHYRQVHHHAEQNAPRAYQPPLGLVPAGGLYPVTPPQPIPRSHRPHHGHKRSEAADIPPQRHFETMMPPTLSMICARVQAKREAKAVAGSSGKQRNFVPVDLDKALPQTPDPPRMLKKAGPSIGGFPVVRKSASTVFHSSHQAATPPLNIRKRPTREDYTGGSASADQRGVFVDVGNSRPQGPSHSKVPRPAHHDDVPVTSARPTHHRDRAVRRSVSMNGWNHHGEHSRQGEELIILALNAMRAPSNDRDPRSFLDFDSDED